MTVRFTDTKDADACTKVRSLNPRCMKLLLESTMLISPHKLMDGRLFGGQRVEAYIADGHERFKKTNERAAVAAEGDEDEEAAEEAKRLERGKHLEGGDEDEEEAEQKHQEESKAWSEQQKASKLGSGS